MYAHWQNIPVTPRIALAVVQCQIELRDELFWFYLMRKQYSLLKLFWIPQHFDGKEQMLCVGFLLT